MTEFIKVNQMEEIKHKFEDKGECPDNLCVFVHKKSEETSAEWDECIRCGLIKNLAHNV